MPFTFSLVFTMPATEMPLKHLLPTQHSSGSFALHMPVIKRSSFVQQHDSDIEDYVKNQSLDEISACFLHSEINAASERNIQTTNCTKPFNDYIPSRGDQPRYLSTFAPC